jgi:uncharacterized protein YcbK (DUF882 family)
MTTRRDFLKFAAATTAALVSPLAVARTAPTGERAIKFFNLHTGEHLSATYWVDGIYIPDELSAINHVLRDHRSNDSTAMDPQLLDVLYRLQQKVGKRGEFHIISGYRSPATNARLSRASDGVAKRSLHMRGKAIDIRLPGTELRHLRKAALSLHAGGVGYYPRSNFIHVDTGRPRFW